jgi:hypothetical protein
MGYADPMQFIMVSSINAQFSVNVSGSAGLAGIGQAAEAAGQMGGSVGYSDSPTVSNIRKRVLVLNDVELVK